VEKYRSPLCTNIVADAGGMPQKRDGWRVLHTLSGRVNGLHAGIFNGTEKRKRLSYCEVTLVFDNEDHALALDFAEVQVTRRRSN